MATTKNPAVLWNVNQGLTAAEQTQGRENIGFPANGTGGQVLVYGNSANTIEWGKFLVKNIGTPTWNSLDRSGFYNITGSQTAGTDNSPESGAVSLLAGSRSGESGQFTTQFVMGSDLFYRTKPSSGSWNSWRPILYQYKDTITSAVNGFKLATTTVGSTVGSRTHYTALINITPAGTKDDTDNPYFAYLEIYQVMEDTADRTQIRLKMLSTPSTSDSGGASPYVIRGTNRGSSSGNYSHDWYITRPPDTGENIDNVTITVTPILCEGNVTFKGLARSTSIPSGLDAYIETGSATPAFGNYAWNSSNTGKPLYLSEWGTLEPCDTTALTKQINGSNVGSRSMPVYIDENGTPTACSIKVGRTGGSPTEITNHMYTAVSIDEGTSGNKNGEVISTTKTTVDSFTFPNAYMPYGIPASVKWPAGIMLFVNTAIWVNNYADVPDVMPVWSSGTTYQYGTWVSYATKAYSCIALPSTSSSSFNPNEWYNSNVTTRTSASLPTGYAEAAKAKTVYIGVFQGSTQLQVQAFDILDNYDGYLTASFAAVTKADITPNSNDFSIKIWTPADTSTIYHFTYNISSIL